MAPHLYKLPYDNDRAVAGAGLIATMPMFLTVPGTRPVRVLSGFLEAVKRPGANTTYGHAGAGSSMHLAAELFPQQASIDIQTVSYRGAAPAAQGMLGGETRMTMMPASAVMQFLQSGDVRALAVTTKERRPLFPNVPTFAEQGLPGYEVVEELALFAPTGTPEPVLRRLNEATAAAFTAPEVHERLNVLAVSSVVGRLKDWPAHFAAEDAKWREVIRTRNISLGGPAAPAGRAERGWRPIGTPRPCPCCLRLTRQEKVSDLKSIACGSTRIMPAQDGAQEVWGIMWGAGWRLATSLQDGQERRR